MDSCKLGGLSSKCLAGSRTLQYLLSVSSVQQTFRVNLKNKNKLIEKQKSLVDALTYGLGVKCTDFTAPSSENA